MNIYSGAIKITFAAFFICFLLTMPAFYDLKREKQELQKYSILIPNTPQSLMLLQNNVCVGRIETQWTADEHGYVYMMNGNIAAQNMIELKSKVAFNTLKQHVISYLHVTADKAVLKFSLQGINPITATAQGSIQGKDMSLSHILQGPIHLVEKADQYRIFLPYIPNNQFLNHTSQHTFKDTLNITVEAYQPSQCQELGAAVIPPALLNFAAQFSTLQQTLIPFASK